MAGRRLQHIQSRREAAQRGRRRPCPACAPVGHVVILNEVAPFFSEVRWLSCCELFWARVVDILKAGVLWSCSKTHKEL